MKNVSWNRAYLQDENESHFGVNQILCSHSHAGLCKVKRNNEHFRKMSKTTRESSVFLT